MGCTCVPWVLMILMVSPFFIRTALPLPPGIKVRSVFGLASTAVAAAAETESLALLLAAEPAQEDEVSIKDDMSEEAQFTIWPDCCAASAICTMADNKSKKTTHTARLSWSVVSMTKATRAIPTQILGST